MSDEGLTTLQMRNVITSSKRGSAWNLGKEEKMMRFFGVQHYSSESPEAEMLFNLI